MSGLDDAELLNDNADRGAKNVNDPWTQEVLRNLIDHNDLLRSAVRRLAARQAEREATPATVQGPRNSGGNSEPVDEEPGVGAVVRDRLGRTWRRYPEGLSPWDNGESTATWVYLKAILGPLTLVTPPPAPDPAQPPTPTDGDTREAAVEALADLTDQAAEALRDARNVRDIPTNTEHRHARVLVEAGWRPPAGYGPTGTSGAPYPEWREDVAMLLPARGESVTYSSSKVMTAHQRLRAALDGTR